MCGNIIPATINVTEPIGSDDNVIAPKRIVTNPTKWHEKASVKRAAISAFGFGGTNAHLIVERGEKEND